METCQAPIHHAPGLRYIAEETPCSDHRPSPRGLIGARGPRWDFCFFVVWQFSECSICCPIWHIRENRPLQKDATRHAVIFHYSMPHSDNFPKIKIFQISRPHFSKISVSKSEFLMPTYQPTTITLRISINSTLFSLSIAISGAMRVHFMQETVPSQTFQCVWTPPPEEFWKPARPPSIMRLGRDISQRKPLAPILCLLGLIPKDDSAKRS